MARVSGKLWSASCRSPRAGGMLSLGRIGLDYLCINEGVVVCVGVSVVGQGVL